MPHPGSYDIQVVRWDEAGRFFAKTFRRSPNCGQFATTLGVWAICMVLSTWYCCLAITPIPQESQSDAYVYIGAKIPSQNISVFMESGPGSTHEAEFSA